MIAMPCLCPFDGTTTMTALPASAASALLHEPFLRIGVAIRGSAALHTGARIRCCATINPPDASRSSLRLWHNRPGRICWEHAQVWLESSLGRTSVCCGAGAALPELELLDPPGRSFCGLKEPTRGGRGLHSQYAIGRDFRNLLVGYVVIALKYGE